MECHRPPNGKPNRIRESQPIVSIPGKCCLTHGEIQAMPTQLGSPKPWRRKLQTYPHRTHRQLSKSCAETKPREILEANPSALRAIVVADRPSRNYQTNPRQRLRHPLAAKSGDMAPRKCLHRQVCRCAKASCNHERISRIPSPGWSSSWVKR